jgi:hypothetical protein
MNHKQLPLLCCLLLVAATPTHSQTMLNHRSLIIMTSKNSLEQRLPVPWFVSHFSSTTEGQVTAAGGAVVMNIRSSVPSVYDASTSYEVGKFFRANNNRLSLIANWGSSAGTIWSIGFDSGYKSQKLKLNHSLFLGATKSWQAKKNQTITLGLGAWLGGGVSESPCMDDYDRQYSCSSLIAWSDRTQLQSNTYRYFDFSLTHNF